MIPLNKKSLGLIAAWAALFALAPFVHTKENPSVTLNAEALPYAYKLIGEARVILDGKGAWRSDQPSARQKNEFIRLRGFEEYSKWHLGIDSRHKVNSKAHYKFPFGDFNALHRCGLLAVKARAHEYGYADIEAAADQLLCEIKINLPTR